MINVTLGVGTVQRDDHGHRRCRRSSTSARSTRPHDERAPKIKTLPLISRNPYNFALVQPGVVGFENVEFGVPAPGRQRRADAHQLPDRRQQQHEKDRAGLRLMPMSEVMIREVKVVTTGFAPEFGQTMGMVYNAITPSGTNTFHGPGQLPLAAPADGGDAVLLPPAAAPPSRRPTSTSTPSTWAVRSSRTRPILRRLRAHRARPVGPQRHHDHAGQPAMLGLTEPQYQPRGLNTEFAIGKVDHQINQANRLSVRYMFFDNFITANVGGGMLSVQRANDFADRQHSTGAQLISTIGAGASTSSAFQYATRAQCACRNALSGTGPAINIPNVASSAARLPPWPMPASASRRT